MKPPEHLDAVATSKWQELAPTLDVTQPGTADALAAYCVNYSRWMQAEAQVEALGLIVKSPAGFPTENPFLGVVKKALIEMHRWGKELGLHKVRKRAAATCDDGPESALSRIMRTIDKGDAA